MQRILVNLRNKLRSKRDDTGGWRIFWIYVILFVVLGHVQSVSRIAQSDTTFFAFRTACFVGGLALSSWLIGRITGWHFARRSGIVISRGWWALWGLIIGLVGRALSYFVLLAFGLVHWQTADYSFVGASFFNSVTAGICEEIAFRGGLLLALQPSPRRKWGRNLGRAMAWGSTSAIFALLHVVAFLPRKPDLPTCVALFLITFAASLLFIWARLAGKSLLLPIGMHFMWDFGLAVGGPSLADTAVVPSWLSSSIQDSVVLGVIGISLWLIIVLHAHSPRGPHHAQANS
jgi:membrane protease YdiL (CAAX protease family)